MCKEKELKEQQNERLTVKKGEVHFLSKEEVEKRMKNRYNELKNKEK